MCKLYAMGACGRGDAYAFARHSSDLHPRPDLSRTQVCPTLINTGRCDSPGCAFVHNASELRKGPLGFASKQIIRRREHSNSKLPLKDETRPLPSVPKPYDAGPVVRSHDVLAPLPPAPAPAEKGGHPRGHKKRALAFMKTRMCVFHQAGRCFKRENCNFAHSRDELRKVPESKEQAPSSKALCALFAQCPKPIAEEDPEVRICVKNTFLELELLTESKIRRSASCPALVRMKLEDEESEDLSTPRTWQRETSAPAELDLAVVETTFVPYDGMSMIQVPTQPMQVAEACIKVPGMTMPPKTMMQPMMVTVCAVQQDYQLAEIPAANMIDMIVIPPQRISY